MAAPVIKGSEATEAAQTGYVRPARPRFRRTDHPGRTISERELLLNGASTPPHRGGEYCAIPHASLVLRGEALRLWSVCA